MCQKFAEKSPQKHQTLGITDTFKLFFNAMFAADLVKRKHGNI